LSPTVPKLGDYYHATNARVWKFTYVNMQHFALKIGAPFLILFSALWPEGASRAQDIFDLFLYEPHPSRTPRQAPRVDPAPASRSDEGAISIFDLFGPQERLAIQPAPKPADKRVRVTIREASPKAPSNSKLASIMIEPAVPRRQIPSPRLKPKSPVSALRSEPATELGKGASRFGCATAKSIIAKYAFDNLQTKSCEGTVYSFTATRAGKPFLIKISALTGELVEVKRAGDENPTGKPEG
jgi:hypothetical protein